MLQSSRFSKNVELPQSSDSMPSKSSNYDYLKHNQVEDSQNIYYKAPIAEPIDEALCFKYSTMQSLTFSVINVISKTFEISKDYLRQNFNLIEN